MGDRDEMWVVLALIGFTGVVAASVTVYALFVEDTALWYHQASTLHMVFFACLAIECFQAIHNLRLTFKTFATLRAFWLYSELTGASKELSST
tara:strand:+ start:1574 stop:1852 length:279 start_codon:yes stop_codon:yes gene_type:complete